MELKILGALMILVTGWGCWWFLRWQEHRFPLQARRNAQYAGVAGGVTTFIWGSGLVLITNAADLWKLTGFIFSVSAVVGGLFYLVIHSRYTRDR